MNWISFTDVERHGWREQPLPPQRKLVLCKIVGYTDESRRYAINDVGGVVVGYLKFAAGDERCPYFVCSAIPGAWEVTHWCDCLPEDFSVPGWAS